MIIWLFLMLTCCLQEDILTCWWLHLRSGGNFDLGCCGLWCPYFIAIWSVVLARTLTSSSIHDNKLIQLRTVGQLKCVVRAACITYRTTLTSHYNQPTVYCHQTVLKACCSSTLHLCVWHHLLVNVKMAWQLTWDQHLQLQLNFTCCILWDCTGWKRRIIFTQNMKYSG